MQVILASRNAFARQEQEVLVDSRVISNKLIRTGWTDRIRSLSSAQLGCGLPPNSSRQHSRSAVPLEKASKLSTKFKFKIIRISNSNQILFFIHPAMGETAASFERTNEHLTKVDVCLSLFSLLFKNHLGVGARFIFFLSHIQDSIIQRSVNQPFKHKISLSTCMTAFATPSWVLAEE